MIKCKICDCILIPSNVVRRNQLRSAGCPNINCRIQFSMNNMDEFVLMQKRFSYNGNTWHFTYSFSDDKSFYTNIIVKTDFNDARENTKTTLKGLILPERFVKLMVFL